MTPEEEYVCDLRGSLVLEQALAPELIDRLNQTIGELEYLGDEAATARGAERATLAGVALRAFVTRSIGPAASPPPACCSAWRPIRSKSTHC
jgi:hypothetical protein